MRPGDIVLVRFPHTDLQAGKLRPALVVAITPGNYSDLLLALISSRAYQTTPQLDEIIEPGDSDFTSSGLKVSSVVRLSRLATVEARVVNARLGRISGQRLQLVRERLVAWFQQELAEDEPVEDTPGE